MDYVPAHGNTARKDDREDLGGCRAFDGEDQGTYLARLITVKYQSMFCSQNLTWF